MIRAKKVKKHAGVGDYSILRSAVLSEKGSGYGSTPNLAVFIVDRKATKDQIKIAVERIFEVNVVRVNTINYLGKPKRTARGSQGRRAAFKKAYITVREGESINVIEGA